MGTHTSTPTMASNIGGARPPCKRGRCAGVAAVFTYRGAGMRTHPRGVCSCARAARPGLSLTCVAHAAWVLFVSLAAVICCSQLTAHTCHQSMATRCDESFVLRGGTQ